MWVGLGECLNRQTHPHVAAELDPIPPSPPGSRAGDARPKAGRGELTVDNKVGAKRDREQLDDCSDVYGLSMILRRIGYMWGHVAPM